MKSSKEENVIRSIADAVDVMERLKKAPRFGADKYITKRFPFGLWFRGHASYRWHLKPCVFRDELHGRPSRRVKLKCYDETNIYTHIKLRAAKYQQAYHSAFDWLCLIQHYSLPTRLLDWTESILIALYFAVKDDVAADAALFVLNARRLNKLVRNRPTICSPDSIDTIIRSEMAVTRSFTKWRSNLSRNARIESIDHNRIESYRMPVAVFPNRLNERMVFQASVFTLHGGKLYAKETGLLDSDPIPAPVELEEINKEQTILEKYKIPRGKRSKIREDLFRLGIHEGTLFPELDHQATYLKQLW
jgi:hypothetical protein